VRSITNEVTVIKLLAEFFREFHYIVGISLPPPSTSDRTFVFVWLSSVAGGVAFCAIMFYIIPLLYFRH
jgi:hypothetical protein